MKLKADGARLDIADPGQEQSSQDLPIARAPPNRQEPATRIQELDVDAFRKLILDFVKQIESASS